MITSTLEARLIILILQSGALIHVSSMLLGTCVTMARLFVRFHYSRFHHASSRVTVKRAGSDCRPIDDWVIDSPIQFRGRSDL